MRYAHGNMRDRVAICAFVWGGSLLVACGLNAAGENGESPDATLADTSPMTFDSGPGVLDGPGRPDAPGDRDSSTDAIVHPSDATTDARIDDASSDTAAPKDSEADKSTPGDAGDASSSDSGFVFTCGSGTTDDCATCASMIVGCVWCTATTNDYAAYCIADMTFCIDDPPAGSVPCPCTAPDPSSCPSEDQVCLATSLISAACVTCGEMSSDGMTCKNGHKCDEATATCSK